MPKERFHILLADQVLSLVEDSGRFPELDAQSRFAFRLGAICPDIFFYDLPAFTLSPFGNRLHRLLEDSGSSLVLRMLQKYRPLPIPAKAWLLGFASHFLADGIWHPIIDAMTGAPTGLCKRLGLGEEDCHRWIESELEGCWIPRLGPRDGYIPLLERFLTDRAVTGSCLAVYRKMLLETGLPGVPGRVEMRKCLTAQVLLLMLFSSAFMGRPKHRLIRGAAFRYLAALCTPTRPAFPAAAPEELAKGGLLAGSFMAQSMATLAGRLIELAEHF